MNIGNLAKKYGAQSASLSPLTTSQKLDYLKLPTSEISKIKGETFETTWLEIDESHIGTEITIDISDLVGINKEDNFESWFDSLETLKKQDHFTNFSVNSAFEDILTNPNNLAELPRVIAVGDKYYVSGNGRHRLTIAKCLGLRTKSIKVVLLQTVA